MPHTQAEVGDMSIIEPLRFGFDTTLIWPCRRADFFMWLRWTDLFSDPQLKIMDMWQTRDGDVVLITNRLEDLPVWFELHPTEVCGRLVERMMEKIQAGEYPNRPMKGPNLWRLRPGDRLVWIGESRPGWPTSNGILSLVDVREAALAVLEPKYRKTGKSGSLKDVVESLAGAFLKELDREEIKRLHGVVEIVKGMGIPREYALEWCLG